MIARVLRAATRALPWVAAALVVTLAVAAVDAAREAIAQGWWRDGLRGLVVDALWRRFDPWAAAAGGVMLVLASGVAVWRRRDDGSRVSRLAVAVLALVALVRLGSAVEQRGRARGPNVLLISIDTLRADHLGAYGHPLPTSPALDRRLAAEGVTFEDVLSQSPKTTPSHMTMFTSLYPCVHGITMWDDATGTAPVLRDDVHTLAELLENAGWTTAAFTAGGPMHASRGFAQGFDEYRHSRQLERTREYLRAHRDRPFFVFFHTYEVHDPYTPPPDLIARFDPEYRGPVLDAVATIRSGVAGWEHGHKLFWNAVDRNDPRTVRFVERLYDAGIRRMDDGTLTSLLDELDALGLRDDTLVILTSDHGEAFGEHGNFLHDDLYRGTLHVPLVLRWPGHLPPGTRASGRARLLDLLPTILDLTGVPVPAQAQGRSLAPAARGAAEAAPPPVFSEHGPALEPVQQAVRDTHWTLLRDGTGEQLFDLAADPAERHDLGNVAPVTAPLRDELGRWRDECRRLHGRYGPAGGAVAPEPDTVRQLRALGYIE